jgi:hypothetical protein
MKMLIKACFAPLLGLATSALASPTIELKDGSRIAGEIKSIENGVYTVRSPSIGTVHVPESNIVRIVYSSGDAPKTAVTSEKSSAHDDALTQNIQQMQKKLAQDPAAIQSIMSLESDPEIQAILNDPAIVKAIQEGDYLSLLSNAKIQALENNEHLKKLVRQQEH